MALDKIVKRFMDTEWLLGICVNGFDDLKANQIHWIDNGEYKGKKWFADPFILDYDEHKIVLLVEEFDYKVHRGRIAKIIIDRNNWTVTDCKIILDLDTHLSFPMIWREENIVYVFPENYHSGGWNMYRYDITQEKLVFVQQVSDKKLTDATLFKEGSKCYLFSTFSPTPNGRKLSIWKSDDICQPFVKLQEVTFTENIARNAGMVFNYKGQFIRPAQECNKVYGHALSFQKISIEENGMFRFAEIWRTTSLHPGKFNISTHTFNQHTNGMAVIDVRGYRHPKMSALLIGIRNILIKFHFKKEYKLQ